VQQSTFSGSIRCIEIKGDTVKGKILAVPSTFRYWWLSGPNFVSKAYPQHYDSSVAFRFESLTGHNHAADQSPDM